PGHVRRLGRVVGAQLELELVHLLGDRLLALQAQPAQLDGELVVGGGDPPVFEGDQRQAAGAEPAQLLVVLLQANLLARAHGLDHHRPATNVEVSKITSPDLVAAEPSESTSLYSRPVRLLDSS